MAHPKHQSYFQRTTGKPLKLLWIVRGFSLAVLVTLLLAMFVFKTGVRHEFCLGLAVGMLIGLIAQLFAIRNVEQNDTTRPTDVDHLSVTS